PAAEAEAEAEEEIVDVDLVETAQGDVLPQTGVLSAVVFYGLGAICIAIGGATLVKVRRKEEE
ncbi:MAG: LPXTG cell wall anchor domain-containing protein, partial [Lachnospiraceae bacterium]|nr:LPXTG cell wall anchor domain-containing protein [Lachnospiraceae bacterium]